MLKNNKIRKAFTLVEMLIVVIIIGILMAALLPKLKGAQERARDTSRKANLSQISTALEMYFNDEGKYPDGKCASEDLWLLKWKYIDAIPLDPQKWRKTYWTKDGWCTGWSYAYSPLKKHGAENGWSALIANIEAEWAVANWVLSGSNYVEFSTGVDEVDKTDKVCKSVIISGDSNQQCGSSSDEWHASENKSMVYVMFN